MKRSPFLLLTFLILFACNGKPPAVVKEKMTEVVVSRYSNNQPKRVRSYHIKGNDSILAQETAFYPNHQKMMEGPYRNGRRHGRWTSWYSNGTKCSEGDYADGLRHGRCATWFENGKPTYEGQYFLGKRTGTWHYWDENGSVTAITIPVK